MRGFFLYGDETLALSAFLQVTQDAVKDNDVEDPLLEGGSTIEERQASFLELALCLAAGLPDAALDPLFVVSSMHLDVSGSPLLVQHRDMAFSDTTHCESSGFRVCRCVR